jgi:ABC-type multidrug transport system permease subunit
MAVSCAFCLRSHWQVGFRNDPDVFFQFLITNAALSVAMNAYGHLIVAISPNVAVGGIFGGLFITLFNLFGGFFIVRNWTRTNDSLTRCVVVDFRIAVC